MGYTRASTDPLGAARGACSKSRLRVIRAPHSRPSLASGGLPAKLHPHGRLPYRITQCVSPQGHCDEQSGRSAPARPPRSAHRSSDAEYVMPMLPQGGTASQPRSGSGRRNRHGRRRLLLPPETHRPSSRCSPSTAAAQGPRRLADPKPPGADIRSRWKDHTHLSASS